MPIWGIDRSSPEAYTALYEKGALILMELEEKVGEDKFLHFLNDILKHEIHTTNDLLAFTEKVFSAEKRLWLENKLKN